MIASVSLTEDAQLNKGEKACKPPVKRSGRADPVEDEPEFLKTQELFRRVQRVLNKLTPQTFQPLMRQVTELTINTEERLKGVVDLIFEKAISEPNFSVVYANMCRCLAGVSVSQTLWLEKQLLQRLVCVLSSVSHHSWKFPPQIILGRRWISGSCCWIVVRESLRRTKMMKRLRSRRMLPQGYEQHTHTHAHTHTHTHTWADWYVGVVAGQSFCNFTDLHFI